MKPRLKKISNQVIVITGATSGIGLATARLAARRGAKLVLVSRNQEELKKVVTEVQALGCEAIDVVADVSDIEAVDHIAQVAHDRFGSFDTWINNAAAAIYGRLTEVPMDEKHRLFNVDFWGTVHGCRTAVRTLRKTGGAIINLGSILSERAIPLQGMYVAAKHAVKGYTDVLRMELEAEGAPISVTLVKPTSIDTPYREHARNYMETAPSFPPPVYSPDVVARAILFCAEHPRRDVLIGGGAKVFSLMEKLVPRLSDHYLEQSMFKKQKSNHKKYPDEQVGLFITPSHGGSERGNFEGRVKNTSIYTFLALHPWIRIAAISSIGLLTYEVFQSLFGKKAPAQDTSKYAQFDHGDSEEAA
jgi:short-subunit dehydrogenase